MLPDASYATQGAAREEAPPHTGFLTLGTVMAGVLWGSGGAASLPCVRALAGAEPASTCGVLRRLAGETLTSHGFWDPHEGLCGLSSMADRSTHLFA